MKVGDQVKVVNCKRSYLENGSKGTIVAEQDGMIIVEFPGGDALMDYLPDEIEVIEENQ